MMHRALFALTLPCLTLPGPAGAQQADPSYGPHMWGAWHGWFLGPVFMILFVVVAVIAVVLLVRWLGPQQAAAGPAGRTPVDILKERFARGEIERQEFEERRRILGE